MGYARDRHRTCVKLGNKWSCPRALTAPLTGALSAPPPGWCPPSVLPPGFFRASSPPRPTRYARSVFCVTHAELRVGGYHNIINHNIILVLEYYNAIILYYISALARAAAANKKTIFTQICILTYFVYVFRHFCNFLYAI